MKFFTSSKFVLSHPHKGFTARFGNLVSTCSTHRSASLFVVILTFLSLSVFPQSGQKFASGGNSLGTGEFLGSTNNYPLFFKVNNVLGMSLTPAGYLGSTTMFFEVKGDGKIVNFNVLSNLFVGNTLSVAKVISPNGQVDFAGSKLLTSSGVTCNKLILSGAGSQISDASGTVSFDGNNITTTAKFTGNSIYFTGLDNHITSATGKVSFDGNSISTSAGINGASLNISGTGTFNTLNVTQDATIDNQLTVEKLFVNQEVIAVKVTTPKIQSSSGLINFDGCNLLTTASITGANLTISGIGAFGNVSANTFQNPLFAGAGNGLILSDASGIFQKLDFDGNTNSTLRGDGTFGPAVSSEWGLNGTDIYSLNSGYVGIGTDYPSEKLDVLGNVNIQGTLYVQDGVIIGQRVNSQRVASNLITTSKLMADTLQTDSMLLVKLEASQMLKTFELEAKKIRVDTFDVRRLSSGNLIIDGQNQTITSTTGLVSFDNTSIATTGNIIAGNFNSQSLTSIGNGLVTFDNNGNFQPLAFSGNANKVLLSDGTFGATPDNFWMGANDGDISAVNSGNVGIGTDSPVEKLDVNGNANIRGTLYVENGVIIGERIYSDEVSTNKLAADTLNTDILITDTIRMIKSQAELMLAKDVRISEDLLAKRISTIDPLLIGVSGNHISIDGNAGTITSTVNDISFGNTSLSTAGDISLDGELYATNVYASGNIATANLEVNGTLKLNIGTPNTNDVLTYDGSGNAMWKTPVLFTEKWQQISGTNDIIYDAGNISLNSNFDLKLRNSHHGLGWYGTGKIFNTSATDENIDGPVLYGWLGGALATLKDDVPNIALQWTYDGKVGIGTDDFKEKFNVNGSIFVPNGNSLWIGNNADNNNRLRMHHNGTNAYIDYMPKLYFRSGNNPNMINTVTFTDDGKVGIGTSDPQSKLHLKDGLLLIDGSTESWCSWNIRMKSPINSLWTTSDPISDNSVNNGSYLGIGMTSMGWYFVQSECSGSNTCNRLKYPFRFLLDGNFVSKEVTIDASVFTWQNYPDFVFNKDYKLMPLDEVELFISKNSHLPDVPAFKEVSENGLKLGEMNVTLLKKIEELTLYSIEQNKRLKNLEEEIAKLRNK